MRRTILLASFTAFALSASCLPCCGDTQAGDVQKPMTVEPLAFVGSTWQPIEEGGKIPTITGGQGFTMTVVGVRAQNVDTCGVQVHANLVRTDTDAGLYDVSQEKNLSMIDENTAASNDSNGDQGVQVIPCGGGIHDACVTPVRLEVTITDRLGHTATVTRNGTYDCGPRYGECVTDGGVDAGP